MTYYNTTRSHGDELAEYQRKASSQERLIYAYMRERPAWRADPETIRRYVFADLPMPPVTSVRRALTNLTDAGMLVRHDTQVTGIYGRPCYTWGLYRPAEPEQQALFDINT